MTIIKRTERRLDFLQSERRKIAARFASEIARHRRPAKRSTLADAAKRIKAILGSAANRLAELVRRQKEIVARFVAGAENAKAEEVRKTIERI